MPQMISKTSHQFDGRELSKGDLFNAEAEFVPILVALGRAELCPVATRAEAPVAAGEYQRRDMIATHKPGRVKRKYRRTKK